MIKSIIAKTIVVVLIIMGITWLIELAVISEQEQRIHWLKQDLESCQQYNEILTERLE